MSIDLASCGASELPIQPLAQDPAAFFSALADPTRLRLIRMLGQEPGGGGLCVNVLALRLGISQPAVSQHLGRLRDLGLVRARRQGVRVHYWVDRDRLDEWRALVTFFFAEPARAD